MCFQENNTYESSEEEDEDEDEEKKMEASICQEMEAKIRQEMEAKIRQEMEAKIRQEMEVKAIRLEEERKREEERRMLEIMKKEIKETTLTTITNELLGAYGYLASTIIPFIKENNVLYYFKMTTIDQNQDHQGCDIISETIGLYITEAYISLHIVFSRHQTISHQEIRPFYWFDSELTCRDLTILQNLLNDANPGQHCAIQSLCYIHPFTRVSTKSKRWRVSSLSSYLYRKYSISWDRANRTRGIDQLTGDDIDSVNFFQTIIHQIPGKYRNGSWRQLDGFFGPYMNETTLEITSLIPELQ
jgi:hypothetical protein